jgi:hypothetical protein
MPRDHDGIRPAIPWLPLRLEHFDIARVLAAAIVVLFFAIPVFAQRINPVGEDERVSVRRSHISLLFDVTASTDTAFSRELLSAPDRDPGFAQLGPILDVEVFPSDRLAVYASVPYRVRLGTVERPGLLPGLYDFEERHGFGDTTAGMSVRLLDEARGRQDGNPLTVVAQVDLVVPTGMSRFEAPDMPLGSGLWHLSTGVGISRSLTDRVLVFSNVGRIMRRPASFRDYTSVTSASALEPEPVDFVRAGIGFGIGETSLLNLHYERSRVGGVAPIEDAFTVNRVGVQLVATKRYGAPAIMFVGLEETAGRKAFVATLQLPVTWRIVGKTFGN